ncbi:acyltransferase family protein [Blastococcus saxobsidens]|uniref:Putative Acyltransferase n=1 Tax=Blastococcus saxobsidens (strain DD2) TaxID=1146883 RepID=H6RL29_BLASD|nr:acyltransferase [Blastococcus saxobsidens]CCG04996.1 putative Acyltransferase [Blastococcus saxobsidens DD2]
MTATIASTAQRPTTLGPDGPSTVERLDALDGLRAVAIGLVLLGHLAVPYLQLGGAVGVTVFFTLSGFLITRLLLVEHERHGVIRLRAFYARRLLRLAPAFVAMVAVVGIVVNAVGLSLRHYALEAALSLGYVANIARINGVDMGPLGHTWSLAVEEQFYLVWPVVLLLILRRRLASAWMPWLLGGIIAASLLVRYANLDDYMRSHDALDVNAYALAIGAFVAVLAHSGRRLPRIPAWVGLAGIVLTLVPQAPDLPTLYPMSVAVSPLAAVATATVLVSCHHSGGPALLRLPLMRWGGVHSYAIYLWHYPLLLLMPSDRWREKALIMVISVIAAVLSRHLVELPALRLKHRFERVPVVAATAPAPPPSPPRTSLPVQRRR